MAEILIKGLEMPQHGFMTITISANGRVIGDDSDERRTHKSPIGRAIPVPPHGGLIDADALEKQVKYDAIRSDVFVKIMCRYLENAPTIVPASEG